jgi:outer membrane receptor protein involved in Fe transport
MKKQVLIALVYAVAASGAPSAQAAPPIFLAQAGAATPANDPAGAQDPSKPAVPPPPSGIEEIVVQGTESEAANDFETADSVTGFGAEDLAALGASDISDLAAFTPNLEIVTQGATTPTFFIRGVGLNDFNSNSTGAVAIYQDDIPINAPALQLGALFDTEAVNVLRGPQGTGLARNASAGAIKVYTRKPSGEFGGFLRSEIGNYNSRDFEGAFESPIYEDIAAGRFAFRYTERDGTLKNRCGNAIPFSERVPVPNPGGPNGLSAQGKKRTDAPWSICGEPVQSQGDRLSTIPEGLAPFVNNVNNWAARGTLLFQPTLDMSWLVNAHGSQRDELSRLGQSIGTRGFSCKDGDVANCGYPGQTSTSRIAGLLGGEQGNVFGSYVPQEIRARYAELAPCSVSRPGFPDGTCFQPANRAQDNSAKVRSAKELARGLDSQPWAGDFNLTGPTRNDTYGGYLKGDIALPGGMQLVSATGYDHYDRFINVDLDQSPETLFQIETDDDGWQVAQGLQLQGQLGYESPVRWDVGGWFLKEQLNVVVTNDLGPFSGLGVGARDYTQDLLSSGGYASLAFDFWDDFTLDGGFRYNWEQKKLDYVLVSTSCQFVDCTENLNDTWHAPTGTIRLTYRFREDTHVFWKYTRGWKPGSYNATSSADTGVTVADPETIDAFETGIRGSWFDGRVGLDTSFFYYSYQDYQIFTAQQFAGGQPEFVILNANSAEVYGAEVDAVFRPWVGAFANVRFGWLETQFLDFVQLQQEIISVRGGLVTVNRELQNTGNPLLNSPRFKVSLTGEQTIPIGRFGSLTGRYDGVWTDQTYFDATKGFGLPNIDDIHALPGDTISQPAYWIHNLMLTYQPPNGRMSLSAWVRNLTNESYKTFAFDATTFNSTSVYFVGDPRTYGGTFTVNF